ncbi:lea domain protein [Colletotrichum plurivorum]|uniref:Lea domain protein n=1 Tax=Colletotrichum plurivorum TaxID=2175906 RepID=A0A8H6JA00_9PEZI|nr:lea domain protein [Colletotrichum plurivorum]
MAQIRDSRIAKRSSNQASDTGKRRAPYALRACDACRRRKGKCDGRQPCRYCSGRSQACSYDSLFGSDEWPLASVADAADRTDIRHPPNGSGSTPSSSSNQDAIMELLSNLQSQLNSLASRVQTSSQSTPSSNFITEDGNNEDFLSSLVNDASAAEDCFGVLGQTLRAPSQPFFGLPTPDYSLGVSQPESQRGSFSNALPPQQLPHDEENFSMYAGMTVVRRGGRPAQPPTSDHAESPRLLRFRSSLGFQEAMRLLCVYQETIGDLHPIVDLDEVTAQTRSCYKEAEAFADDAPSVSEDDLLIINLVLAIGLNADATVTSLRNAKTIRDDTQAAFNSRLVQPVSSVKHVAIVLLKGSYDFLNDMPQSAWRMCGTAGRMLMELGFHNGEMSEHMLNSQAKRSEVWNLMSSIVILDRLWSAAAGLPTNFHESSFGPIHTSSMKVPYLKAMLSFILLRDKMNDPLARAAKAQRYDDEDAFEILNFQVEQWRKRAVGNHSTHLPWQLDPHSQPPSWTILLNLRAESVRSLLLQPHFFSRSDLQTSKKYLTPAIEVLFDVCNVLYNLNSTTDIYRRQQPYYQPLLASASALGFVLTSSLDKNRTVLLASLSADVAGAMGRSYEMAVALATGYAERSKASLMLAKKLSTVRGNLVSFGMLKRMGTARADSQMSRFQTESTPDMGSGLSGSANLEGHLDVTSGTATESGWEESLQVDWMADGGGSMFSDNMF